MADASRPSVSLPETLASGRAALKERRYEDADAAFAMVLEQQPRHRSALTGLAWARRGLGDLEGALEHFRQALSLAPEDPKLLRNVVREARRLGRLEEALRLADEALTLLPVDPWFAVERAHVLEAFDAELGRAAWGEAAALAPDDVEVALGVARAFDRDHEPHRSAETLRGIVRVRPGEHRLLLALALSEIELGRGRAALEALDAIGTVPHPDGMRHSEQRRATELRIRAHLLLGQPKEAIEALDSGMDEARDPEVGSDAVSGWDSTWRGEIAAASWDLLVAQEHLERALSIEPTLARARRLAQLRLAALDPLGAREAWRVGTGLAQELQGGRAPDVPWRVTAGLIGDLINEYLLEPDLTAEARTALLADDVGAASALVRRSPDSQAAATGLIVILRRAGALNGAVELAPDGGGQPTIPRRLNQAWLGSTMPDDVQRLVSCWKSQHDEWEHVLVDDRAARDLIAARQRPGEAVAFRIAPSATWRADLLRLILLDECGGFWADADDLPLATLESIRERASLIVPQEPFGAVGNHLIGATPGHRVIRSALEEAIENLHSRPQESPWLAVGPGPLTRALARELAHTGAEDQSANLKDTSGTAAVYVLHERESVQLVSGFRRLAYKSTSAWWRNSSQYLVRQADRRNRFASAGPDATRIVLCRPRGGLNDCLQQVAKCADYAARHTRVLVIDSTRSDIPLLLSESFFIREPAGSYNGPDWFLLDGWSPERGTTSKPNGFARWESPSGVRRRAPKDGGVAAYVDAATGEPLTFDFTVDHPEEVLIHEQSGTGDDAIDALARLRIADPYLESVRERLAALPSEYTAIHIRNTDLTSPYIDFLSGLRTALRRHTVIVCSDDRAVIADAQRILAESIVIEGQAVGFPRISSGTHRIKQRTFPEMFVATMVDLLTLAFADELLLCPVGASIESSRFSGFSVLARKLNQAPHVACGLLAISNRGEIWSTRRDDSSGSEDRAGDQ